MAVAANVSRVGHLSTCRVIQDVTQLWLDLRKTNLSDPQGSGDQIWINLSSLIPWHLPIVPPLKQTWYISLCSKRNSHTHRAGVCMWDIFCFVPFYFVLQEKCRRSLFHESNLNLSIHTGKGGKKKKKACGKNRIQKI